MKGNTATVYMMRQSQFRQQGTLLHGPRPRGLLVETSQPQVMTTIEAPKTDRDRQLLAAMARGDEFALRELYATHAGLLYSIIYRILRDSHESKDVLQESFLRIWKQAPQYRPERGEPATWMSFLARNIAIDTLRRRDRRPRLIENEPAPEPMTPPRQEADLEKDHITFCMAALTEPQREALEMAYFQGCSQAEIATAMQIPLGNVKNHLKRGLIKLRQLFHRHD